MELLFGLIMGYIFWGQKQEIPKQNLLQKWDAVLNYSSSCGARPIPPEDRLWVANLFEQAENYCRRSPTFEDAGPWIVDIRNNYKNKNYNFS